MKTLGLAAIVLRGMAVIGAAAIVAAWFFDGPEQTTLLAHGVLLGLLVLVYWTLDRALPFRPVRFAGIVLCVMMFQPACLIVATLIAGDVGYLTRYGFSSYAEGTLDVAIAEAVFALAIAVGAAVVGAFDRREIEPWPSSIAKLSDEALALAQLLAAAAAVTRILLLFELLPTHVAYAARIFALYFSGFSFFVGVGLRRFSLRALLVLTVISGASLLALLGGNRQLGIEPLIYLGFGYLAAAPLSRRVLVAGLALGGVLLAAAMHVSGAIREDGAGRSGDVALTRIESVFDSLAERELHRGTLLRVVHTSGHAVLTSVPELVAFDERGITRLPSELARAVIPRFEVAGRAEEYLGRNSMLRELGFLIEYESSVELPLVGDAWYRGGFSALLLIGFFAGIFLQLAELLIFRRVARAPIWNFVLLAAIAVVVQMESYDVVWGARTFLLRTTAAALVAALGSALFNSIRRGEP